MKENCRKNPRSEIKTKINALVRRLGRILRLWLFPSIQSFFYFKPEKITGYLGDNFLKNNNGNKNIPRTWSKVALFLFLKLETAYANMLSLINTKPKYVTNGGNGLRFFLFDMSKLFKTTIFIFILIFPLVCSSATEFICDISETGDYTSLAQWENAVNCNLLQSKTANYSNLIGEKISDGTTVSWADGSSGILLHMTDTKFLISVSSGTINNGDVITDGVNSFTVSSSPDSVIAVAEISSAFVDRDSVSIAGWETSENNYIDIHTAATARHAGKWNFEAYRLQPDDANYVLGIFENNVRIDGLQIMLSSDSQNYHSGIFVDTEGETDIRISNNIIRGVFSGSANYTYGVGLASMKPFTDVKIWNNIIYDFNSSVGYGIATAMGNYGMAENNIIIYNNTIFGCTKGIYTHYATGAVYLKNNICNGNTYDYDYYGNSNNITFANNISQDDSSLTESLRNLDVLFTDETNGDFHLSLSDTTALDQGVDLNTDSNNQLNVTKDIDGQLRDGVFDIGADSLEVSTNTRPVLESIGNKTVNEGQNLSFEVFADDADNDTLEFSASNLMPGASFDSQTHVFSWSPGYDQAGEYNNLTFTVSDGELSDSEIITITVNDSDTTAPAIAGPFQGAWQPIEGQTFEQDVVVWWYNIDDESGIDQSAVKFGYKKQDETEYTFVPLNECTGNFCDVTNSATFPVSTLSNGTYDLIVEVSNNQGLLTQQQTTVYVQLPDITPPDIAGPFQGMWQPVDGNDFTEDVVVWWYNIDDESGIDQSSVKFGYKKQDETEYTFVPLNECTGNFCDVTNSATFPASTIASGVYTLYIEVKNGTGLSSEQEVTVNVPDTVPPEVVITFPQDGYFTYYDQITVEGTVDGVAFSQNYSLNDGENVITKTATDQWGNSSSAEVTVECELEGTLIGPLGGEVFSDDGKVKLTVPPCALNEEIRIQVLHIVGDIQSTAPSGKEILSAVQCLPAGETFLVPLQITYTLDEPKVPGSSVNLGYYDSLENEFVPIGQDSVVNEDSYTVDFIINHFSAYAALSSLISQGAPIGAGVQIPLPDMLTGAFSHAVALAVVPARRGMQPKVSLTYRSSNSNSWTGVGFNLEIGKIIRSTRLGKPSYDDTVDTFYFISDAGTTELVHLIDNLYQSKIESSFTKFYKESDDSWRVVSKDGSILYFGQTSNSKETTAQGTFNWNLTKAVDTNGNFIEYNYIKDQNKSYLDSIEYTGHESGLAPTKEISFILEDRSDIFSSYISGEKVVTAKRLKEIQVKLQGSLVWRYVLNYEYSPDTNRSLIKSINQYSSEGENLPTQSFIYQTANN